MWMKVMPSALSKLGNEQIFYAEDALVDWSGKRPPATEINVLEKHLNYDKVNVKRFWRLTCMSIGVLMIHGFSGGPYEILPLANYIKDQTNWIIETPTLTGHGEAKELSLKGFKAEHWLMDAEIALRKLIKTVDTVYIAGFSMGGLIALYLAKRYKVEKLVLLSAAARYVAPGQILKDLRIIAEDAKNGHLKENELFKRYEHKINRVPVSSTIQFMRIVKMVEPYIQSIETSTYIVQGKLDGLVPYTTAQYLYDQLASEDKYIYYSPNGKHHICFSDDCNEWFQKVLVFLQGNSNV